MFSAVRFIRVTRDIFTVTRVITMIRAIKITCVKGFIRVIRVRSDSRVTRVSRVT